MVLEIKRDSNFEKNRKAMIRAMCCVKLLDRRNSEELMDMLGIQESFR